jgi:ribonuclease P protein component
MNREQRLTKDSEFSPVLRQGKTLVHNLVVLKALPNGLEFDRYGFVVSRKVGKAVVRNKVKRRMREAVRATPIQPGWDLVFIARDGVGAASYQGIEAAIKGLLHRARLLSREQE